MHAYKTKGGVLFHFSGDLSGDIILANGMGEETRLTFADLAEFVDTHRKLRHPRGPPRDPTRAEERARALGEAKAVVTKLVEFARDDDDVDHVRAWVAREVTGTRRQQLTELERQLFEVAINSVKGAR